MTDLSLDVPTHVTHHHRGRRTAKPGLAARLQAAFDAFAAPERFEAAGPQPASNDNTQSWPQDAVSLTDPLALPPDWHSSPSLGSGDLLSLSFLPFDR